MIAATSLYTANEAIHPHNRLNQLNPTSVIDEAPATGSTPTSTPRMAPRVSMIPTCTNDAKIPKNARMNTSPDAPAAAGPEIAPSTPSRSPIEA